jgi:hypothetical protein
MAEWQIQIGSILIPYEGMPLPVNRCPFSLCPLVRYRAINALAAGELASSS